MLVWQDMPSGDNNTPEGIADFGRELDAVIGALRNHPSIVTWVPFNEGWGQHETGKYVAHIKELDPTRLVNNASGWTDQQAGDIVDGHAYPGPAGPRAEARRAAVIGEFGGLGLPMEGHTWLEKGNWGYRSFTTQDDLGKAYRDLMTQLRLQIAQGASAAIYTQTTDVEIEVNGLMTYDRAVTKMSPSDLSAWNAALYETPAMLTTIVPSADDKPLEWSYTTVEPSSGWMRPDFDASPWSKGVGGFGRADTRWGHVGTAWTTTISGSRRTFDLGSTNPRNAAPQDLPRRWGGGVCEWGAGGVPVGSHRRLHVRAAAGCGNARAPSGDQHAGGARAPGAWRSVHRRGIVDVVEK